VNATVEVALQPGQKKLLGPVKGLVKAVLAAEGAGGLVSVALVDEREMARLNKLYRHLDSSTDVLSFRQADSPVEWPDPTKGGEADLGEVIVCPAVVERFALEESGDPEVRMGWTILHGMLHLLGYDHEKDHGEMRAREQELLSGLDPQVRAVARGLRG
jgi:rRNA maturation RNase YbeY